MVHVEEDVIIRIVRSLRVAHLYRALAENPIIIPIVRSLRAAHLYRSLTEFSMILYTPKSQKIKENPIRIE